MEPGAGAVARARALLSRAEADPTGRLKALIVLAASSLTSLVLWYPLGLPSELMRGLIAQPTVICSFGGGPNEFFAAAAAAGTPRMLLCSSAVAALTMAGPVLLIAVAFVYRKALTRIVKAVTARLPAEISFLFAPLLATVLFAMAWSGSHYTTAWSFGLLPQTLFPGVVGLFTFAVARWGGAAQTRLGAFFERRDRVPAKARLGLAALVPIAVSLVLMGEDRVSLPALKEQIVVIVGLASGFLALAPRSGDVMSGVRQQAVAVAREVNEDARRGIARVRAAREEGR